MRILVLLFVLLPLVSLANVDMVMSDAAQNELIISWSLEDTVFAGKYTGGEFTQVITEQGLCAGAVSIATDDSQEKHILLAIYQESDVGPENNRVLSYSCSDFAHESTHYLNQMEYERIGFLKTADDRWDALLAHSSITFCSSVTQYVVFQYSYSISTSGVLTEIAEGFWNKNYYFNEYDDSSLYPAMMVGPVACPGGNSLIGTSYGYNSTSQWLISHTLMFDPDSADLSCYTMGEGWDPNISGVMGLGSSSDSDMILLYADDSGDVNWSDFTPFSPVPESANLLPWDFPGLNDPVAFTSTFELPGMLMVWYRDGELRCRHWNGEWNNYDYFVASSVQPPNLEEIAVCADTDGYWVAWLPGDASEPEVVFVSFDDVTGVEEEEFLPVEPVVRINPITNPMESNLTVDICGISSGVVTVTDISGRTVLEREVQGEGLHSIGELPVSGMYFIRLHHSTGNVSCRVVSF